MTKPPLSKPKFEQLMSVMGYEFMITGEDASKWSIGENTMAFQTSVLAVGYVPWTGGISVPATNSTEC